MSRTVVIVVNYNNDQDTTQCVNSLQNSQKRPVVVAVDNASTIGDIEAAVGTYPDSKLIYSPTNLGFGRGNNLGIRWALSHTDCEFIFLLNNDAMVEPDTITKLETALDDHPEAGVASPRIVMAEEPDMLWYGGGEVAWRKGSARVPGYLGPADATLALSARNVSFASGCAMLVRRSVLQEAGGFDPRFFMYEEDLELCLRVQEMGWTIRYVPEALVLHKVQGTQRKRGEGFLPLQHPHNPQLPFLMRHITKNRLLTMTAHARGRDAVRFWTFFPAFWAAKCLQFALHGRWDAVYAVAKGVVEFWSNRGKPANRLVSLDATWT